MGSLQGDIETSLSVLRRLTDTDFAALAWTSSNEQTIRWRFVSGNRNERYKKIVMFPGKGIGGKVFRSGRPMVIQSFSPKSGDDPREYPILLAEGLHSAIAVPVTIDDQIMGVLLVGCRMNRVFPHETLELVLDVAEQLGAVMQKRMENDKADPASTILTRANEIY
ncbi:histidine kinase [Collibacillus ludicampi]|jgi:nitrogen regulatory protein A|uniref:Histidine kinase n=1 Tax=Collibacillus ludicampi TaxID=2771369 RepID=A0AAV4LJD8_9BACL|nr:GAF domain-containing protein [Collibacillus ludicampi]GIM47898.1 histidine kinase [Collibacillus ludicampi]